MAVVVPPPMAVANTEREPEEGSRLASITMLEDEIMELAVESPAPALEDGEIVSSCFGGCKR